MKELHDYRPEWVGEDAIESAILDRRANLGAAAEDLGLGRSVLLRRILSSPYLTLVYNDQIERNKDYAEEKLMSQIDDDVFDAIKFYLETKGKDRGYYRKIELAGNVDVDLVNKVLTALGEAGLDPKEVMMHLLTEVVSEDGTLAELGPGEEMVDIDLDGEVVEGSARKIEGHGKSFERGETE